MDKILIIKTSALGDIIHAYPVLSYLRKKFPQAQIDWVVESTGQELVEAHPYVNETLLVSTKAWRKAPFSKQTFDAIKNFHRQLRRQTYDVIFDLQGNLKSGLILSRALSKNKVGFGGRDVPEWPNLLFTNKRFHPQQNGNIRQDYLDIVSAFFGEMVEVEQESFCLKISPEEQEKLHTCMQSLPEGAKVVVCLGSAWPNKQLAFEALSDFLSLLLAHHQGATLLFTWGAAEEQQLVQNLHHQWPSQSKVLPKMGLSLLQNLMKLSDFVVAVDSLPLHLAGTTSTPTFSVFGPSSAAKYKPLGRQHVAFQGSCPYKRSFVKRCPILRTCSTGACIKNLKGMELFDFYQSKKNGSN